MIAVVGGEASTAGEESVAYELGREVARRGHVLICGGREGIMAQACRGAVEAGGTTVGILPGDDRSQANKWVTIPIATGLGAARNTIIPRSADVVVAIGGRYGTLSEIAFAFIAGRPVVGIGTSVITLPTGELAPIIPAETAAEAIALCEKLGPEEA